MTKEIIALHKANHLQTAEKFVPPPSGLNKFQEDNMDYNPDNFIQRRFPDHPRSND
ncbi:hypothetical protein H4684_003601 [Desulfomicrobium macestii]|uniref:Uncharacterized protein n=1 Tax=Desulfomicrobium macestii TaxID=90731 RepID=A0ABR9H8V1_9BACT|nr:hypothetical protein [Desulfomicrobium macestii]MBE1426917.1 hypothetical protein [Desulfomicrobium macestii]